MSPRAYLQPVRQLLLEPGLRRAVVLLGPRRVGKTILIHHLIDNLLKDGVDAPRIAYVEMDHPLLHGQSLEAIVRQIEESAPAEKGVRYIFFDEIQSHKDWEKHLKPLVDHRADLRILVFRSSIRCLPCWHSTRRRKYPSSSSRNVAAWANLPFKGILNIWKQHFSSSACSGSIKTASAISVNVISRCI